jgi:hypothetical protein
MSYVFQVSSQGDQYKVGVSKIRFTKHKLLCLY